MVAASPSPSAAPPATTATDTDSPSVAPPATASPSAAPPASTASPSAAPPATTATDTDSPSVAPPATAAGRPHPSYTKMITQALAELGGTCGRAAIAGFILGRFTGLPATHDHDALLSAHLRRLVAKGVVRIYGSELRACYVFPASDTRGRGRPRKGATRLPKNLNLDDDDSSGSGSGSDDDDETISPAPLASCVNPDWDPNSASGISQQNSVPNLDGFQSNTSEDDVVAYSGEHDDDDEYTPARAYGKVNLSASSPFTKRGRGRPRKLHKDGPSPSTGIKRGHGRPTKEEQQSQAAKHPPTPTASSTGGVERAQQSQAATAAAEPPPTPTVSSTGGIKRGRGRPTKEQQSEATKPPPTPPASRGFKLGCGRPMLAPTYGDTGPSGRPIIIDKLPPATWSVDPLAASAGVKRPRGRPRVYRPMPTKTGDGLENPVSVDVALENPRMHKSSAGDIVSMVMKRGCGNGRLRKEQLDFETEMAMPAEAGDAMPAEAGDATPAETGGAASAGIKRPRGRPRKEKPAAAMSAQAGDAVSAGIKRGRGRPRKEKPDSASAGIKRGCERPRKYNPAAAVSAEDGDAVSTGMKGPLENPIRRPSARDIVWMVMNRECGPAFETWFGDMTEASRHKQQVEEGGEKTRPRVEEEKVFGTGSGGMFATSNRAKKKMS